MRALALAFLAVGFATAVAASERGDVWRLSPIPVRDAVRATVEGQLRALRAEKFGEAYEFAASGIRRQFTAPVFAAMIRRGYPMLLRHRRFEAGLVRDDRERHAQVTYTLYDSAVEARYFRYTLVSENGRWLIEAVVAADPEKSPGI